MSSVSWMRGAFTSGKVAGSSVSASSSVGASRMASPEPYLVRIFS